MRGADLLASDAVVQVAPGGRTVEPDKVEAGTGFNEKRFTAAEITPAMGDVKVTKTDKRIAGAACTGSTWRTSPRSRRTSRIPCGSKNRSSSASRPSPDR